MNGYFKMIKIDISSVINCSTRYVYYKSGIKKIIPRILTKLKEIVHFELKTDHIKFYVSGSGERKGKEKLWLSYEWMISQSRSRVKMVYNLGHRAGKVRFDILHLRSAFSIRFEITFVSPPGGWKVTDRKIEIFCFSKKCNSRA